MLGVAIITFNEERNLERTLQAIKNLASEIVIVDSHSTDQTQKIATALGARVITRSWSGFANQKQFAINELSTPWILALDADEVITPECAQEIKEIINSKTEIAGYRLPRYMHFMGRTLKFGKGVDHPLRLFKKGAGNYDQRLIHEQVVLSGDCSTLRNGMIHYSAENISERINKIKRDNELEARHYNHGQGQILRLIINPLKNLYMNLFKRKGYKDGVPGLINTLLFAYQLFDHEYRLLRNPKGVV